jgi:DNA integrity scanning protein DisA with diadenylate cyclase activity
MRGEVVALHGFLRSALMERLDATIEELGALTALDGATIVTQSLALAGFGVVLPLEHDDRVIEARDASAVDTRPFDLRARGTRHRAAATYARNHPGTTVFVASSDGHLGCLFRASEWPATAFWRFHSQGTIGA